MKSVFLFTLFFAPWICFGQRPQKEQVMQISGVVLVGDSLLPAPYIGVVRTRDQRGTYCDRSGYFTLPVLAGDTLEFFNLGLKTSFFVIPRNNTERGLSLVQVMEMDTITLPTAYILPYPSPLNFRKEVLALDLPNDGFNKFSRSLASITHYDGMSDFKDQAYRNSSAILDARYNNGFVSGGNLLNASAWNKFMRSMKEK
ncbi:MAG: hypothetical protein IT223_12635 [Crocinitomicaceae bacterium]|nr:hypothetical protein [Crocinitomicaceae bacterium]